MFIVIFDNEDGLSIPYCWDPDCEGALTSFCCTESNQIALFDTRREAQKAIRISTKRDELAKEQKNIRELDFIDSRELIHIVPVSKKN